MLLSLQVVVKTTHNFCADFLQLSYPKNLRTLESVVKFRICVFPNNVSLIDCNSPFKPLAVCLDYTCLEEASRIIVNLSGFNLIHSSLR